MESINTEGVYIMPKNQMSDKLKSFANKPIGRVVIVAAIAALLLIIAVIPGMLPKNASESDRRLARSFMNLTKSENTTVTGSATVVSSSLNANFDINVGLKQTSKAIGHVDANIKFPGSALKIPLDFVGDTDKSDLYFKVSNTDDVLDNMNGDLEAYKLALSPIAVKVNGKWIHVGSKEKSIIDPCTSQLLNSFKSNKNMSDDLAALIANNKALQVSGVKTVGDASVYDMKFDANKLDETFKHFKNSSMFKGLDKCNAAYGEPDQNALKPQGSAAQPQQQPVKADTSVSITVDSSDKITNIEYKTSSNGSVGTVKLALSYEKEVIVKVPTENIVQINDIQDDLTRAVGILMAPQLQAGSNMLSPYTQATNPNGQ